jgi:predicted dehydrogenase
MRIAFIGVSHWHTQFYIEPIMGALGHDAGIQLVGVSDPLPQFADRWSAATGAPAFADYRIMCERLKPDLVFALGRHSEMAAEGDYLIRQGIPFAMEKPCGVSVAEVESMEKLARANSAFVAIPFMYRISRFVELIREFAGDTEMTYGMFRQIPGPVSRYREWDSTWNLERRDAGGGCTLNLSILSYDLARVLAPSTDWRVDAASMSNAQTGIEVEDFSATILASEDGRRATIETGYNIPGRYAENMLSVVVGDTYFSWNGREQNIRITTPDGAERLFDARVSHTSYSPEFVIDTVRRVRDQIAPDGDLTDMLAAARMAESAYRLAGFPGMGVPASSTPTSV